MVVVASSRNRLKIGNAMASANAGPFSWSHCLSATEVATAKTQNISLFHLANASGYDLAKRNALIQSAMAQKKPKFYVVWEGHKPGVYSAWPECQKQIAGFSGAKYKSFPSLAAAEKAYTEPVDEHWGKSDGMKKSKTKTPKRTLDELREMGVDLTALAVDAACKGNPGPLEYQGVEIESNINLFHQGPFPDGTVNIGEFLAIVHALALLKHGGNTDRTIYSDSRIGMGWVKGKKCKTKLTQTVANKQLFQLIRRAEKWLRENEVENPIVKWETKLWGEIPADFGRK